METEAEKTIRPFWCGSQFADWESRNCYRCKKFDPNNWVEGQCEITDALGFAYLDSGYITPEIADRCGYTKAHENLEDGYPYTWDCPERELQDQE